MIAHRQTFLRYCTDCYFVTRPITDSTRYRYASSIQHLDTWAQHEVELPELNDLLISRWVAWLCDTYRPKTAAGKRGDVLVIWRAAAEDGLAIRPGKVRGVKVPRPVPTCWTLEEFRRILWMCDTIEACFGNGLPRNLYLRTIFSVAYQTGFRRGDLFRLSVTDVTDAGVIRTIQNKTLEGHVASIDIATLADFRRLAAMLELRGDPNWETPLRWPHEISGFYYWWDEIRRMAQLPDTGAFQQIRRTGATYVERDQPGAAMRYLGHKTPGLAYRHYVDVSKLDTAVRPPAIP